MYLSPLSTTRSATPPPANDAGAVPAGRVPLHPLVDVRNGPAAGLNFTTLSLGPLVPDAGGLLYILLEPVPAADTPSAELGDVAVSPPAADLATLVRHECASGRLLKTRWIEVLDGWMNTAVANWRARQSDHPTPASEAQRELLLWALQSHFARRPEEFAASSTLTVLCGMTSQLPAPMRDSIQHAVRLQIEDDALIDPESRAGNEACMGVIDDALALPAKEALRDPTLRRLFDALHRAVAGQEETPSRAAADWVGADWVGADC